MQLFKLFRSTFILLVAQVFAEKATHLRKGRHAQLMSNSSSSAEPADASKVELAYTPEPWYPPPAEAGSSLMLAEKATSKDNGNRLLIFWAVGSSPQVIQLVKKNCKHARDQLKDQVDIYLAHYDSRKSLWYQRAGRKWYAENIKFSSERRGYKVQLMLSLLPGNQFPLQSYDWVWAIDEDIDFTRTHLPTMLETASDSKSFITLPAFTEIEHLRGEGMSHPFQKPHKECDYRYVSMLEIIFPLIRPKVIQALPTCDNCFHKHSVWGLCMVWCHWSAKHFNIPRDTACAVLDKTPVVHMNYKTLDGKYSGEYENRQWVELAIRDMKEVEKSHPAEFSRSDGWKCVRNAKTVSHGNDDAGPADGPMDDRINDWLASMDSLKKDKAALKAR